MADIIADIKDTKLINILVITLLKIKKNNVFYSKIIELVEEKLKLIEDFNEKNNSEFQNYRFNYVWNDIETALKTLDNDIDYYYSGLISFTNLFKGDVDLIPENRKLNEYGFKIPSIINNIESYINDDTMNDLDVWSKEIVKNIESEQFIEFKKPNVKSIISTAEEIRQLMFIKQKNELRQKVMDAIMDAMNSGNQCCEFRFHAFKDKPYYLNILNELRGSKEKPNYTVLEKPHSIDKFTFIISWNIKKFPHNVDSD